MSNTGGPGLRAALLGGLVLGFAMPPAVVPFAEWLVVPGLMVWFAIATNGRRPLLHSYLFGCVHMAWFSWSVQHLLVPAYVSIVVLGGLYYVLATAAVRRARTAWRAPMFAVVVAASFWLRAVMPEIHYPHGQPCHCLWEWPLLLRSVAIGGEPLANAALAFVAAAAMQAVRSWRVAAPAWRSAQRQLVAALVVFFGANVFGWAMAPAVSEGEAWRVLLVEPGFHPREIRSPEEAGNVFRDRVVEPTRRELVGDGGVDLVVWTESALPHLFLQEELDGGRVRALPRLAKDTDARILAGAMLQSPDGYTPVTLSIEAATGRVVGYQGKRQLVPGGEFLPLVGLLPEFMADIIRDLQEQVLGGQSAYVPAAASTPLATVDGRKFGTLICYDNAFPGPSRELVDGGASLLAVLSNETWFAGRGEVVQMIAMSVVRAIESATPVVRSTTDGWSVAIDANGCMLGQIELRRAPQPTARILRVSVPPGPGCAPPLAWLQQVSGPLFGVILALLVAHAGWSWVRIRSAGSVDPDVAGPGSSGQSAGGS